MKSIKRKIFALVLSFSLFSGLGISAMRVDVNGDCHFKQQIEAKSRNLKLPSGFYSTLEGAYVDFYNKERNSKCLKSLLKIMEDIKNRVEIFKGFDENKVTSSNDIETIKSFDVVEEHMHGYDKLPGASRFTSALGRFDFFIYYKRGEDKKLIELGVIYNDRKDAIIYQLKNYKENIAQSNVSELNIMPVDKNN